MITFDEWKYFCKAGIAVGSHLTTGWMLTARELKWISNMVSQCYKTSVGTFHFKEGTVIWKGNIMTTNVNVAPS